MGLLRAHVIIEGKVQGVYFRAHTREMANKLGIKGWVRNNWDGTVEAVFEGEEQNVRKMVEWCHKGPETAIVTKVHVKWEEYKGEFDRFFIKYDFS